MGRRCGGALCAITFKELPVVAVHAVLYDVATRNSVVRLDDIVNNRDDSMGSDTTPPAEISDSVVSAHAARVTVAF